MEIEKKIRNKVLRTNSRAKVSMNRLKILITVVGRAKADFYMDHIQSFGVNMQMVLFGQGTAPREIATAMGLADSDRAVIISVIGENQLAAALDSLAEKFNTIVGGKGMRYGEMKNERIQSRSHLLYCEYRIL